MPAGNLTSHPQKQLLYAGSGVRSMRVFALALLVVLSSASVVCAEGPSLTLDLGQSGTKQTAVVLQILALLTVLSLAPALFIMVTSFTRMSRMLGYRRSH